MRALRLHLLALLIIALMGVLLVTAALRRSPTIDEPFHTTRGLAYWWEGDARLSYAHPPLANALAAAPAAIFLPRVDFSSMPGWEQPNSVELTHHWFERDYPAARTALMWCRASMCALTLCFAGYFYFACLSLFGRIPALCALPLLAFNPTLLAHGGLMTTDFPVTFGVFAMVAELARYLRSYRKWHLASFAFAAALAMMAKYTAVPLFAVALVLLSVHALLAKRPAKQSLRARTLRLLADLAVIGAIALLVANASYGFERTGWTVERILVEKEPENHTPELVAGTVLKSGVLAHLPRGLPIPLPYTLVFGLSQVGSHAELGHPSWFWGESGAAGWPSYFPILLSIKTPLPLLLFLGVGAIFALKVRRRPEPALSAILVVVIVYLVLLVRSRINIGVRHALPLVPLLTVLAGLGASSALQRARSLSGWHKPAAVASIAGALGVMPIVPLLHFPDYLGYFNLLVGRARGHTISIVSEDWGQDVIDLAKIVRAEGAYPLYYVPYSTTVPEGPLELRYHGVSFELLNCAKTPGRPAWVAVHVTAALRKPHCVRWLKNEELEHTIHDHIRLYRYVPEGQRVKKRTKNSSRRP